MNASSSCETIFNYDESILQSANEVCNYSSNLHFDNLIILGGFFLFLFCLFGWVKILRYKNKQL